jgi:hypothetical protein
MCHGIFGGVGAIVLKIKFTCHGATGTNNRYYSGEMVTYQKAQPPYRHNINVMQ